MSNGKDGWKPGIAGFSAGAVSTMLLLPLDNIKVRLQVNEGPSSSSSTTAVSYSIRNNTNRLGAIRMLQGVVKYEGIMGLYQGMVPAMVGSAVSWGGFFCVYENMKRQLIQYKLSNLADDTMNSPETVTTRRPEIPPSLNSLDNFMVGTLSGIVMVAFTNPIWLIKLRLQLQMKRTSESLHVKKVIQYDGFLDAFRQIYKSEGILGLYKGTGPALLLTTHGGVQFVVYEFLRKNFHYARAQRRSTTERSSSVIERFEDSIGYLTIGAFSKMVASTVTYPLQVLKSRMQQPPTSIELTNTGDVRIVTRDYKGLVATAQKMWKNEGVAGFFKGAIPNAIRVAPSAAVTFLVYESLMDMMRN